MAQIIRDKQSSTESKQYFIPMAVTKETLEDYGLKREDARWTMVGGKKILAIMVPATKEVYDAYMQPIWAEEKKQSRQTRCKIPGKSSKLIRCPDSRKCEECEHYHKVVKEQNKPASLDALAEMGAEPSTGESQMSDIEVKETLDKLIAYLSKIKPEYGQIFEMLYDQKTQAAIAEKLGMPPRTVSDEVKKIREILKPIGNQMYGR